MFPPKNEQTNSILLLWDLFFFFFLEDIEDTKKTFWNYLTFSRWPFYLSLQVHHFSKEDKSFYREQYKKPSSMPIVGMIEAKIPIWRKEISRTTNCHKKTWFQTFLLRRLKVAILKLLLPLPLLQTAIYYGNTWYCESLNWCCCQFL